MKINHVAVYVENLDAIKEFYVKYFGATSNSMYHNPNTGLKTYFLTFEDGGKLEIMTRPDIVVRDKEIKACGYIHIAFSVGTKEKVDEITNQLRQDKYTVISEPRTTGDGYYESCVLDPEGNQIEIVQ